MIYLVRHGEAAAGWGSHPDPGLSDKGQSQAKSVATDLLKRGINQTFSSPMQRCQETAAPFVAESGTDLQINPHVTEIPTPPDVGDRVSWLQALMSGTWDTAPELVQAWQQDLISAVSSMPENTVIFSHFVAINALVAHVEGRADVTLFRPDHCSVTVLQPSPSGLRLIERGREAGTKVL